MTDLLMITSDAYKEIINAIGEIYPRVPWQRCQFHFLRNISEGAPKKYQAGLRAELQDMFNSQGMEEAREKRDAIIAEYQDAAENAMACLDESFESCMTAGMLSAGLYRYYRNLDLTPGMENVYLFPNNSL